MNLVLLVAPLGYLWGQKPLSVPWRIAAMILFLLLVNYVPYFVMSEPLWVVTLSFGTFVLLVSGVAFVINRSMRNTNKLNQNLAAIRSTLDNLQRESADVARTQLDPKGYRGVSDNVASEIEAQQLKWR